MNAEDDRPAGPPRGVKMMAAVRWGLVGVMALVALLSVLAYAGVRVGQAAPGSAAGTYHCPMHPAVVQDHPGECPICSMTLVPNVVGPAKSAAGARGSVVAENPEAPENPGVPGLAAVELTPDRVQLIGMRTAIAKSETLSGELRAVGIVAPSERGLAQVNARYSGWIEKLVVSETGAPVRRGQVLATIYSPDVLRAEQELLLARGWAAEKDLDGKGGGGDARRRLELLGLAATDIDEILRSGKAGETVPLRSPVEGYVVGKNAVAGLALQPGTALYEIADLRSVWVTADVHELDIGRVRIGQPVRFEAAAFPGTVHTGKVQFIHPVMDAGSRTLRVRLELRNRFDRNGPALRPGMYGTVRLDLPATTGLMVPAEAVVDTGETQYVFVARDGGRFEPRVVTVGTRTQDRVQIKTGVAEGETVVTTGNFLIDSESRLRAAIEGETAGSARAEVPIDRDKYPEKYDAWKQCEIAHRGMGTMEEDCKNAIPKPWK